MLSNVGHKDSESGLFERYLFDEFSNNLPIDIWQLFHCRQVHSLCLDNVWEAALELDFSHIFCEYSDFMLILFKCKSLAG